jgi:hypothetical protein
MIEIESEMSPDTPPHMARYLRFLRYHHGYTVEQLKSVPLLKKYFKQKPDEHSKKTIPA